jgi:hypothetical protein
MEIIDCLSDLCQHAQREEKILERSTNALFRLMADEAKRGRFVITKKHAQLIEDIHDAGMVADSALCIKDLLLDRQRAKFIDWSLPASRDRRSLREGIRAKLHNNNRGYVYVAWRRRPEAYFYIGKAGSNDRVNLDQHGKLLEALKSGRATTLSFVFPSKSTKMNVTDIEAALLQLVVSRTGHLPKENSRRESIGFVYNHGSKLVEVAKMLEQIRKGLADDLL